MPACPGQPGPQDHGDLACETLFPGTEPRAVARALSKALSMARAALAELDTGQQALPDQLAAALEATCRAWDGGQRGDVVSGEAASGDVVARLHEALGIARNLGFF